MSDGASCACERRDRLIMGLVCSRFGVWFALYWVFFLFFFLFFFYKHLYIAVLGNGVWFAFALNRLYWGLVFSANDVTVVWFLICSVLVFFFFLVRIHGFATSVLCWACRGQWAWLCYQFFFFLGVFFFGLKVEHIIFFFFYLRVFLILWLRVFLIWIKYKFFLKKNFQVRVFLGTPWPVCGAATTINNSVYRI